MRSKLVLDMRKRQEQYNDKLWDLNPTWDLLTTEQKAFIDNHTDIRRYRKNEVIHREGDYPTHIMMLISGMVRLSKEGVGQRVQIIRLLKPYDMFGYRSVIVGDGHSSCASALEPTVLCRIQREAFMHVLQENNAFCFGILKAMAKDLGISESRTVNLTQKHIRGRLAETLITLRQTYGLDEDGATIAIYMSREDIANMSNMTTSNAIRTLSQFVTEGLICMDGRKIQLLNEAELTKISRLG